MKQIEFKSDSEIKITHDSSSRIIKKRCIVLHLDVSEIQFKRASFVNRPEMSVSERYREGRQIQGDAEASWKTRLDLIGKCHLSEDIRLNEILQFEIIAGDSISDQSIITDPEFSLEICSFDSTNLNSCAGILSHHCDANMPHRFSLAFMVPATILFESMEHMSKFKVKGFAIDVEISAFEDTYCVFLEQECTISAQLNSITMQSHFSNHNS